MIWWLAFEKKPFWFWREIWIQVIVILLQLYNSKIRFTRGNCARMRTKFKLDFDHFLQFSASNHHIQDWSYFGRLQNRELDHPEKKTWNLLLVKIVWLSTMCPPIRRMLTKSSIPKRLGCVFRINFFVPFWP